MEAQEGGKGVLWPGSCFSGSDAFPFGLQCVFLRSSVVTLLEHLRFALVDCTLFWMFPWPCQSPALWRRVNASHNPCLHSRPGSRLSTWTRPPRGAYLVGALENSLVAQTVKNPQQCRRPRFSQEKPLERGMTTHSSILSWRIPRTEEPGGLQSMGSQRVG